MDSVQFVAVMCVVMLGTCSGAPATSSSRDVGEVHQKQQENKIVRYEVTQTETGSKFIYELEDGQFRQEEVFVLNKGTEEEEIAVIGSYSFWGTDDQLYITRYTADRNGYNAKTTHTPRNEVSLKTSVSNEEPDAAPLADSNQL